MLVLLLLGVARPQTAAAADTDQWLHAEGNRIVNSSGETVVLRGVNIEKREWDYRWKEQNINYERKAIPEATSGWGANVVLLAVASGPINRGDKTYLRHLDELVALAKKNDAYTLLVYRYSEPDTKQPKMPDQAAEDAMARLASRYSNEPAVLYGLQVEPHDVSWSDLKPRFTSMIDAIREENPRALIAVPGTNWGRYVHWALEDPIERDNLIYKSHIYNSYSSVRSNFKLQELSAKYPVILGEFGIGQKSSRSDIVNLLDLAEENGISWIAWLFQDDACPCLLRDRSDFTPTSYGELIKERLAANESEPDPVPVSEVAHTSVAAGAPQGLDGEAYAALWLKDQVRHVLSAFVFIV